MGEKQLCVHDDGNINHGMGGGGGRQPTNHQLKKKKKLCSSQQFRRKRGNQVKKGAIDIDIVCY